MSCTDACRSGLLGDDIDVRAFHAEVLKDGSVPLDVLEGKIDRWIAAKKA